MAGYIGTKAVNLSTTGADIAGDADVSGALDVGGAFPSQGIDDNANATAITIDSSENVGIGTSSPVVPLTIYNNNSQILFHNSNTGTTTTDGFQIGMGGGSSTAAYIIQNENDSIFLLNRSASGSIIASTNNTERMCIDSAGRVTTPSQPHIHGSPNNSSGSGIANVFYTAYSRNTLSFSNSRVTVPVAGAYLINFNTISDTSTGRVDATILINGGDFISALSEDNGQGFHQKSLSVVVNLSANDYIQVSNADWYSSLTTSYTSWKTLSITLVG